jgi:hypothetical protein
MKWKSTAAGLLMTVACLASPCLAQTSGPSNPLVPLCAPYALYPDSLLAQVLAAATYPEQVLAASVWCKGLRPRLAPR